MRAKLFVVAIAGALTFLPLPGGEMVLASESIVFAYLIDPRKLADLIGSQDPELERRMLARTDIVEDLGLERRFSPPEKWREAVSQLIAGERRDNDAMEGFVIMIAAATVGEPAKPPVAGAPFLRTEDARPTLRAVGQPVLAEFFERLDRGNDTSVADGLLPELAGKLEHSDYPVRVSVHSPADAARYGRALREWQAPDVETFETDDLDLPDDVDEEDAGEFLFDLDDYRAELQAWFDAAAKGRTLILFLEDG